MSNKDFIELCKEEVIKFYFSICYVKLPIENVYILSSSKNDVEYKVFLTACSPDSRVFEGTYCRDKKEVQFNIYMKEKDLKFYK